MTFRSLLDIAVDFISNRIVRLQPGHIEIQVFLEDVGANTPHDCPSRLICKLFLRIALGVVGR